MLYNIGFLTTKNLQSALPQKKSHYHIKLQVINRI